MRNWRRLFLGSVSSVLIVLPVAPLSVSLDQALAEQEKKPQGQQSQSGESSKRKSEGKQQGKSATGEPTEGGPQGEDKSGGSGPSGPQSLPPGGAPQFEGGKKKPK